MDERFHSFERSVEDWHWWYRVRRTILDQYVERLDLDPAKARLLDVGCGTGGSSLVLSRHGQVTGLDAALRSFHLSPDRPSTHRVVAPAAVLPFRDQVFDVVAALDVLEHLDDDVAGARELHRVLRPGGSAVIFVPAFNFLWRRNDDFSHHRRRYTARMLERTLTQGGFRLLDLGYFNLVLFLPQLAATLAERLLPSRVERFERDWEPSLMNSLLERLFRLEVPLLRRRPLPFGASVVCLARRD